MMLLVLVVLLIKLVGIDARGNQSISQYVNKHVISRHKQNTYAGIATKKVIFFQVPAASNINKLVSKDGLIVI
jgi:phage-related holin